MRSAPAASGRSWVISKVVRPRISVRSASITCASCCASQRRRRLVEQQHAAVAQQGARDGQALALSAGQARAALAEHGVVALRQPFDEAVGLGPAGGFAHRLAVDRGGMAERDVVVHGGREQQRLLRHQGDLAAQAGQRVARQRLPVDLSASRTAVRTAAAAG